MSNTDDHGPGSLRQAIVDANDIANVGGVADEIDFDIPGSGLQVISPLTGLPPIMDPVVIDGYTQPGSSPNNLIDGDSATLLVVLDGSLDGFADGLQLYAGNSTVRGLVINQFTIGINVSSPGSNVIEGNFIGTDAAGLVDLGNTDAGVAVRDSPDNRIGGSTPEARNVISGTKVSFLNTGQGIAITGPSSVGNLVQGNFIGTDATGMQALGNGSDGVLVSSLGLGGSAFQTTVSGNLISGNARDGIEFVGGGNNLVAGNLIGTDVSGTKDLGNADDGVIFGDTTDSGVVVATTGNNTVGGTTVAERNIISANGGNGIAIVGSAEVGNLVVGNFIGTNIHGEIDPGVDLGNTFDGVILSRSDADGLTASHNRIGGITTEERNIISGNHRDGVSIIGDSGPDGNLVQGNFIGADRTGFQRLGNGRSGVRLYSLDFVTDSASNNTIGGSVTGAGNLISANGESGVAILGASTGGTGNVVQGNFIGTDVTGTKSLANPVGVSITADAFANLIGGGTAGAADIITPGVGSLFGLATPHAGNLICSSGVGVDIRDFYTLNNRVEGNLIGTNLDGSALLGVGNGVQIAGGAGNIIGGTADGTGNLIEGHADGFGISIAGASTMDNRVEGNYIGTNLDGSAPLGKGNGVQIAGGASHNVVGGIAEEASNLISGNSGAGILISDTDTMNNRVEGNLIGTDVNGGNPLANSVGVAIGKGASNNTIGGLDPTAGNLISGNSGAGVLITDSGTMNNQVEGNFIGTDVSGDQPLANSTGVAILEEASNNTIGGTESTADNIISGNVDNGVIIRGAGTTGNVVQNNFIGTNDAGETALGNQYGVVISSGAFANMITTSNVISGNIFDGILIDGTDTTLNRVEGNTIGGNQADASVPLRNRYGVVISGGASGNIVGGTEPEMHNFILGNDIGVLIRDTGTTKNAIEFNFVGSNVDGTTGLGNHIGIVISSGASANVIGGEEGKAPNVIAGNNLDDGIGIEIRDPGTTGNLIEHNFIGSNFFDDPALNNREGIVIGFGASDNVIGGTATGAGNFIAGNDLAGIRISGTDTTDNRVEGNIVGHDIVGEPPQTNLFGVQITAGASGNVIGGTEPGSRNVISDNVSSDGSDGGGVEISGIGTTGNRVEGNFIGTNQDGSASIANKVGVSIGTGASGNVIGGTSPDARNLISGNEDNGITITDAGTTGNLVEGNYIGTNDDGTGILPNVVGVSIESGASQNVVGGTAPEARNVISGNLLDGIFIDGTATSANLVQGNFIGTAKTGSAPLYNIVGVAIGGGASQNVVGGLLPGGAARNLISGNTIAGIVITGAGTSGNVVEGNNIGTNQDGTAPLPNRVGVSIGSGASQNLIGAPNVPERSNLISGNTVGGILISDDGTTNNQVAGNFIGTNRDGSAALANNDYGVEIAMGASGNEIGGTLPDEGGGQLPGGNLISGNGNAGVVIAGNGTTGNQVQGNRIGTSLDGNAPLPNGKGVSVESGASMNVIGGTGIGDGNVISGNSAAGVSINDLASASNRVQGNLIGTNQDGSAPLGNGSTGVTIAGTNNLIGGTADFAANTIAFNSGAGVTVFGSGNAIQHNAIFSNAALGIDLAGDGVTLNDSQGHTGPNNFQNFPFLGSSITSAGATIIAGILASTADTTFTLEFFASPAADPSGFGQGQQFLGSAAVTTDDGGEASFTVTFPSAVPTGDFLTATATDPNNNTSEFSQAVPVGAIVIPSLSIDNVTVTEGNSGTVNATFTVSLSAASSQTVTVDFATADGTATAPADYVAIPTSTLTFNPGETSKPITVAVKGDTLDESDETFFVQLSNPNDATLAVSRGLGTILDDDTAGTVQLDQSGFSVAADGRSITITVNRSGGSASGVTVDFATSDGTARAGTDYTATAGTLTFGAGETSRTITIPILNNTVATGATTIKLTLSNPTGGASLGGSSISLVSSVSLVSANSAGTGSGNSDSPILFADPPSVLVSADGRYVVFGSAASDLVANDNNGAPDIFERDLLTGTTSLVSVNSAGTGSGSNESNDPRVSADGRFVLFESFARDLGPIPGDFSYSNGDNELGLYVRDTQTGTTEGVGRVLYENGHDYNISADGRYVVFGSTGILAGTNDNNFAEDVFVRDLVAHTTSLVSVSTDGSSSGHLGSTAPAISALGRVAQTAGLVSVSSDAPSTGNAGSTFPVISADGRFVAFFSAATDLVTNKNNGGDIYVRDLQRGLTTLVSVNQSLGGLDFAISSDGRYVVFSGLAPDLVANGMNVQQDIFERDLMMATTTLVSVNSAGTGSANGISESPRVSSDGRFVVFDSDAGDLVADGTNFGDQNVFVRDVIGGTTTLVSVNQTGTPESHGDAYQEGISADGRFVAFTSSASDLVAHDTNGLPDIFARDLLSHTTTLISANGAGTDSGNGFTYDGLLSADGSTIVFVSLAADLVPADTNGVRNVFAAHLQAQSTVVLTGSAQLPALSINDVTVTEGNSGTVNATFTVTLSADSSQPVTVSFATADGTATASADYVAIPTTTLTFNPGETSKPITVAVKGDTLDENDETFFVQLSNPNGAILADAQGLGTILDDDTAGSVQFDKAAYSVAKEGGSITITVDRTGGSASGVTVDFATSDGTAHAGTDYTATVGTLTFGAGETNKTFIIPILNNTLATGAPMVNLTLSNPTGGATLGATGPVVLTIVAASSSPAPASTRTSILANPPTAGVITLVATVTGTANNSPSSGTVEFFDTTSGTALGTMPVDSTGHASLATSTLAPGTHVIIAVYSGAMNYVGSTSSTVNVVIDNNLPGPIVDLLQRYGYHAQPTTLVLTFSEALDPARAQNLGNYRIVPLGRWRRHHGRPIAVRAAVYDPVPHTVTLWPAMRLNIHRSYQLIVNGSGSGGLTGVTAARLGAVGKDDPGTNYVAVIDWRTLAGSEFARRSRLLTRRHQGPSAQAFDALAVSGHLINLATSAGRVIT